MYDLVLSRLLVEISYLNLQLQKEQKAANATDNSFVISMYWSDCT